MKYSLKLFGGKTDLDLNWISTSKKELLVRFDRADKSTHMYNLFDKIYKDAESDKILYLNKDINFLYDCLLRPFLDFNGTMVQENFFHNADSAKIKGALQEARAILSDVLGVETNVIYDFNEYNDAIKRNIAFYIDKFYDIDNLSEIKDKPLDFVLEPSEFYKFIDTRDIIVTVVVPVQLLRDLIHDNFHNMSVEFPSHINPRDIIPFSNLNYKINMGEIREKWTKNFINNYKLALYGEYRREIIYNLLYTYFAINKSEYDTLDTLDIPKDTMESICIRNRRHLDRITDLLAIDEYKNIFKNFFEKSFDKVHPITIIHNLCEASMEELKVMAKHIGLDVSWINVPGYSNYDSRYLNLLEDKKDIVSNSLCSCIVMKRMIPWIMLVTSCSANTKRRLEATSFIKNILNMESIFSTHENYANSEKFINNMKSDSQIIRQLGNILVDKTLTDIGHMVGNGELYKFLKESEIIEGDVPDAE